MIEWYDIGTVPVTAHIQDYNHNPEHPLTPTEVRERAVLSKTKLGAAVWRKSPFVGIMLGITERTWKENQLESIELSFIKPEKGAGDVTITAKSSGDKWPDMFIITTKSYDENILTWCRQLLKTLEKVEINTIETDNGMDA
jgi:hypothetical protein